MNDTPKRLALVDAGSVYHPAYHVLTNFATRDGSPTGQARPVAMRARSAQGRRGKTASRPLRAWRGLSSSSP